MVVGIVPPAVVSSTGEAFAIAYDYLSDYEASKQPVLVLPGNPPEKGSKRLKVNKMFSEQFENYQQVLEKSDLIEDPAYVRFRNLFLTDDFSTN